MVILNSILRRIYHIFTNILCVADCCACVIVSHARAPPLPLALTTLRRRLQHLLLWKPCAGSGRVLLWQLMLEHLGTGSATFGLLSSCPQWSGAAWEPELVALGCFGSAGRTRAERLLFLSRAERPGQAPNSSTDLILKPCTRSRWVSPGGCAKHHQRIFSFVSWSEINDQSSNQSEFKFLRGNLPLFNETGRLKLLSFYFFVLTT